MKNSIIKVALAIVLFTTVGVNFAKADELFTAEISADQVEVTHNDWNTAFYLQDGTLLKNDNDAGPRMYTLSELLADPFNVPDPSADKVCQWRTDVNSPDICVNFWLLDGVIYATNPAAAGFGSAFVVEQVGTLTASLGYMASHYIGNILAIFAALVGLGGALMFISSYIGKKA